MKEFNINVNELFTPDGHLCPKEEYGDLSYLTSEGLAPLPLLKSKLLAEIARLAMSDAFPIDEESKTKYIDGLASLFKVGTDTNDLKEGAFFDKFVLSVKNTIEKDVLNKASFTELLKQHQQISAGKFLKDLTRTEFIIKTEKGVYLISNDGTYKNIKNNEIILGSPIVLKDLNRISNESPEKIANKIQEISTFFKDTFGISEYQMGFLRTVIMKDSELGMGLSTADKNGSVRSIKFGDETFHHTPVSGTTSLQLDLSEHNKLKIHYYAKTTLTGSEGIVSNLAPSSLAAIITLEDQPGQALDFCYDPNVEIQIKALDILEFDVPDKFILDTKVPNKHFEPLIPYDKFYKLIDKNPPSLFTRIKNTIKNLPYAIVGAVVGLVSAAITAISRVARFIANRISPLNNASQDQVSNLEQNPSPEENRAEELANLRNQQPLNNEQRASITNITTPNKTELDTLKNADLLTLNTEENTTIANKLSYLDLAIQPKGKFSKAVREEIHPPGPGRGRRGTTM